MQSVERSRSRSLRGAAVTVPTVALLAGVVLIAAFAALSPTAAEAKSCGFGAVPTYEVKAKHLKCKKANKVASASFDKITKCLENGRCRAKGFRCKPNPAEDAPPGLAGGIMVCKKGDKRVRYGYGG